MSLEGHRKVTEWTKRSCCLISSASR